MTAAAPAFRMIRFARVDSAGTIAINPLYVLSVREVARGVCISVTNETWIVQGTLDDVLAALDAAR